MRQISTAKRQGFWDLRAAGNFVGGGTGTGLILASVIATAAGGDARLPMAVGLGFVMLGLSLVWLEIGKPWRALNVFFHPQTSWMTREGIVAAPLGATVAGFVVFGPTWLLPVIAVLAAAFLYCQARILRASRGIPAWKQPEIVPLILATGLAEGTGLFVALGHPVPLLIALALAGGLAREAAWSAYSRALVRGRAPRATLAVFASAPARALRLVRWSAMVLLALAWAGLLPGGLAGGLLAAVSGWGIKAMLVTRAAYTRGPLIPHTPVRGRGISRTVEA